MCYIFDVSAVIDTIFIEEDMRLITDGAWLEFEWMYIGFAFVFMKD